MSSKAKIGFPLGMVGGIIFGAIIDNMALGIILGLVFGGASAAIPDKKG